MSKHGAVLGGIDADRDRALALATAVVHGRGGQGVLDDVREEAGVGLGVVLPKGGEEAKFSPVLADHFLRGQVARCRQTLRENTQDVIERRILTTILLNRTTTRSQGNILSK